MHVGVSMMTMSEEGLTLHPDDLVPDERLPLINNWSGLSLDEHRGSSAANLDGRDVWSGGICSAEE